MKRKDTIISITAHISTLAFNKDALEADLNVLANNITFFGENEQDHWTIKVENISVQNTAIDTTKVVRFIYSLNYSNSNYENSVLMHLCLNLQKFFNSKNLILNKANQCWIDNTYNSRLDK